MGASSFKCDKLKSDILVITLGRRGRALPKSAKFNLIASQATLLADVQLILLATYDGHHSVIERISLGPGHVSQSCDSRLNGAVGELGTFSLWKGKGADLSL